MEALSLARTLDSNREAHANLVNRIQVYKVQHSCTASLILRQEFGVCVVCVWRGVPDFRYFVSGILLVANYLKSGD